MLPVHLRLERWVTGAFAAAVLVAGCLAPGQSSAVAHEAFQGTGTLRVEDEVVVLEGGGWSVTRDVNLQKELRLANATLRLEGFDAVVKAIDIDAQSALEVSGSRLEVQRIVGEGVLRVVGGTVVGYTCYDWTDPDCEVRKPFRASISMPVHAVDAVIGAYGDLFLAGPETTVRLTNESTAGPLNVLPLGRTVASLELPDVFTYFCPGSSAIVRVEASAQPLQWDDQRTIEHLQAERVLLDPVDVVLNIGQLNGTAVLRGGILAIGGGTWDVYPLSDWQLLDCDRPIRPSVVLAPSDQVCKYGPTPVDDEPLEWAYGSGHLVNVTWPSQAPAQNVTFQLEGFAFNAAPTRPMEWGGRYGRFSSDGHALGKVVVPMLTEICGTDQTPHQVDVTVLRIAWDSTHEACVVLTPETRDATVTPTPGTAAQPCSPDGLPVHLR